MLLGNAFSLNMVNTYPVLVDVQELSLEEAKELLIEEGIESAVGHEATAAVFSNLLGLTVPCNRITLSLGCGSEILVGQYRGPRLEEGATELPEGATIQWLRVFISCL